MSKQIAARPSALTVPTAAPAQELAFAYALVEGPPGRWTAVCLEGVTARALVKLEPNGDAEPEMYAMRRITRAIELRTIGKKWRKP
jgi:hypothetical protein